MRVLELFAGSQSFSKQARLRGLQVFTVDWCKFDGIDLCKDIGKLSIADVPFVPDIIWVSPDCTTYSVAALSTHRNGIEPRSAYAKKCDAVNKHVLRLIKKWQTMNKELVYFIENPRGMLRKMPFMQKYNRHTVWYCQYGDTRAKPTDIWTNSKTWIPRAQCFNGNKDCHHVPAPRGSSTGTQGIKNAFDKSKIPVELCKEVLCSVIDRAHG